jgi:hypothetical protein
VALSFFALGAAFSATGFSAAFLDVVRAGAWKTGTGITPFLTFAGAVAGAFLGLSTTTVAAFFVALEAFGLAGDFSGFCSFAETFFNTRLRAVAAIVTHFMSYRNRTKLSVREENLRSRHQGLLLIEISSPPRGCGCPKYGR